MTDAKFDLVVIGSGPAGQKGAIAAAKLGKRVAVIDRQEMIGGVSLHTGTIPSKTLREAILYLSGFRQRSFYGRDYRLKERVSVADLGFRVQAVLQGELEVLRSQLSRNGITTVHGTARFREAHTLEVETAEGPVVLSADFVLIACGTRAAFNPKIPFDGKRILHADQLAAAADVPRRAMVVGAGVIGLEYAAMLTALDVEVTIIEQRSQVLDFVDAEIVNPLSYQMRRQGAVFRLGEKVVAVTKDEDQVVTAVLESGKQVHADCLLYAVGRQPNTDQLNLEAAGLVTDARGRLAVNANYQTTVPHIYAAGDIIGFPSLAASAMEQGRLAARTCVA